MNQVTHELRALQCFLNPQVFGELYDLAQESHKHHPMVAVHLEKCVTLTRRMIMNEMDEIAKPLGDDLIRSHYVLLNAYKIGTQRKDPERVADMEVKVQEHTATFELMADFDNVINKAMGEVNALLAKSKAAK